MMKRFMLRGTNIRNCKGVLGIIVIPRHQYSSWFIIVLNTELRPHLVVSEIIAGSQEVFFGSLGVSGLWSESQQNHRACLRICC